MGQFPCFSNCHLYNIGVFLSCNIKMDLLMFLSWDLCKDRLLKSSILAVSINRQLYSVLWDGAESHLPGAEVSTVFKLRTSLELKMENYKARSFLRKQLKITEDHAEEICRKVCMSWVNNRIKMVLLKLSCQNLLFFCWKSSKLLHITMYVVICTYVGEDFLNSNIFLPHLGCHRSKIWCHW